MATTRTPSITVLADGRQFIDKRYLSEGCDLSEREAEVRRALDEAHTPDRRCGIAPVASKGLS